MRARPLVVLAFLVLGSAGAGVAWRSADSGRTEREAAAETSRIRGWARSQAGAGVSVLPKRVPAADPARIRALRDLPGFHEYAMRCSSCHVLPDPGAYPAERWAGKVGEMREHVDRAGILPPREGEIEATIEFLRAASTAPR